MKAQLKKFMFSEALFVLLVALLVSTSINTAYGTDTSAPVVNPAPQPDVPTVGGAVIRETEPLSGASDSPVKTEEPTEMTPDGKAVAGSTDVTKAEDAVEDEMERAPNTASPLPAK